ncbi:FkbM family methyltransferase [Puniceibacterium sp. IMCC21224]|uniref:FkbM family methyltransferase n=1 Tax=Puniceibacterium sp. IMCC21224 TaxID=1618204 RepID=UPI00064DF1DD|nr:FkbM family methyltransferase [Puniceibacterium sp. IMCC21224]KMK67333.1 methyltransferase, FkbM family [Puniceibacterium sp. IMCC21224]
MDKPASSAADQPRQRDPYLRSRGMKIPKHPQITTGRVRGALKADTYERKECEAALRVVREGDVVLELGGGIGYMSTLIATHRKVRAIHSYEANPALIPYIHSVHAANNVTNVTVHNALLSDGAGDPVPFYVRANFLASSIDRDADPDSVVRTEMIERHDINAVLQEVKPTILVCDIEGAEAHLLPGADFSGLRAAIIELHPQWIGQSGVQAVFDTMHRAGLSYFPKASHAKVVTFRNGW